MPWRRPSTVPMMKRTTMVKLKGRRFLAGNEGESGYAAMVLADEYAKYIG